MNREFVSPLFGKKLPDLATIRSWADEEGCKILEGAARLACWRRELESSLDGPPRIQSGATRDARSRNVTRTDLLRAVLAVCADALGVSSLRDFSLDDAPAKWAQIMAETRSDALPDSVEKSIARPWMLEHARDPGTPIGVRAIVGVLGFEGAMALGAFDMQYLEGLVTARESACRILGHQGEAGTDMMGAAPVLPIYLDRNRYLAQIDAALAKASGVIVVAAQPNSGRHALVEAWIDRLVYERQPEGLAALDGTLSALDVRRLNQDFFGTGDDALLLGFRLGGSGVYLQLRQAIAYRPGWVDDLAVVADDAKSPDYKIIVTTTKDHERQLAEAHPLYKDLPRVEVVPPAEADLLALWWCQLPFAERRIGLTASLPVLIEAFARSTNEERARPNWQTVALALARLHIEDSLDVRLDDGLPSWTRWSRALRAARAGKEMGPDEKAFLERFVGPRERLLELAEADDELAGKQQVRNQSE